MSERKEGEDAHTCSASVQIGRRSAEERGCTVRGVRTNCSPGSNGNKEPEKDVAQDLNNAEEEDDRKPACRNPGRSFGH